MDEVETALDLMKEYVRMNMEFLSKEWFLSEMIKEVESVMEIQFGSLPDEIYVFALLLHNGRTAYILPPYEANLDILREQPALDQRSPEWHTFRHKMITASVVSKALGTEAQQRELIKIKRDPQSRIEDMNFEGPRHWGVKYEPVSIQYYEHVNDTRVEAFGCIVHPSYPFLAASPDGIVAQGSLYGRMLEIKNPFSRVLTGNPKEEYWMQCQLQMEVCNLDACDFLETKFVEYESEEAFRADGTFQKTEDGKYKGIFLQVYSDKVGYMYPPFQCTEEEYTEWSSDKIDDKWINTVYWKLEEVYTTLIGRQREWFAWALPKLEEVHRRINLNEMCVEVA